MSNGTAPVTNDAFREPLDTRIEIVTPENIAFQYRIAGPFRRMLAYAIDILVRVLAMVVIVIIGLFAGFASLGAPAVGVGLVMWFIIDWFYGGLFEALWNGQTPGKYVVGLRVLNCEGQPIHGYQAILRNFLRAADAMPVILIFPTYQVGFWTSLLTRRMQRLGDLASGTIVVIDEPAPSIALQRVTDPAALALAEQLPRTFRASRSLARTLAVYVARRKMFTIRRQFEIAQRLAEPLRQKLELPVGTNPDQLLCAMYQRTFVTDLPEDMTTHANRTEEQIVAAALASAYPQVDNAAVVDPGTVSIRT